MVSLVCQRQQNTASEVEQNAIDRLEPLNGLSWTGAAAEELQLSLNFLKVQELSGRFPSHP